MIRMLGKLIHRADMTAPRCGMLEVVQPQSPWGKETLRGICCWLGEHAILVGRPVIKLAIPSAMVTNSLTFTG